MSAYIFDYLGLDKYQDKKEQINVLQEKINQMNNVKNKMMELKSSYRQNIFDKWKAQTKEKFPDMHPSEVNNYYTGVSFLLDGETVSVYITENKSGLYCQINFDSRKNIYDTKIMNLKDILPKEHAKARWEYFSNIDFDGVYRLFIKVAERCKEIMDK